MCWGDRQQVSELRAEVKHLRAALFEIREALQGRCIDGVDIWGYWLDDDGTLHRRVDKMLDNRP